MLKKTITFEDFNGEERTEDFYFNLNRAELAEMATAGDDQDMESKLRQIIETKNNREILELFQFIIEKSYGRKSPDGRRFIKDPEFTKEFFETDAYSELLFSLGENAGEAAAFIRGILPSKLHAAVDAEIEKQTNQPSLGY